jgi:hypothetical protein
VHGLKSKSHGGELVKIEKVELSGMIVLFIGVILLAFTFISAYTFLIGKLSLLGSQDILRAFGEALAPLIEAIIRILYLGIMGWLGSILTIRGVQLLKKEKTETLLTQQQPIKTEPKPAAQKESKPEAKETKTDAEKPTKVEETEKTKTQEKIDKPEGATPSP